MKSVLVAFTLLVLSQLALGGEMTAKITGFRFAMVYAEKLEPTQKFYEKYLGFEKLQDFRPGEIYGKAGDIEIWMQEGYKVVASGDSKESQPTRVSVMFGVDSVGKLFNSLKEGGETLLTEEPVEMMPGTFWLQFKDPSGNIVEVLGAK